jgi:murein DD-endopeptidase MepM/ murein hydrolase activator NlpD
VDIAVGRGGAVRAPAAGEVVDVAEYALAGRTVVVDHGQGVKTAYFHLDSALVRRGDVVEAGQRLARVGGTGLATGPHLHFGVYVHGRDVDPASWYRMPAWALDPSASAAPAVPVGGAEGAPRP